MCHELYFFSDLRYVFESLYHAGIFSISFCEKMLHCKIDGKDLAGSKLKCRLKCDVNWIQLRVRRALKCLEPLTRIGNDFTHPNLGRIKLGLSTNSVLQFGKAAILICGWNCKRTIFIFMNKSLLVSVGLLLFNNYFSRKPVMCAA